MQAVYQKLGLIKYFDRRTPCEIPLIKNRLISIMQEQWREEIDNKPKLRTYKLFKNEFKTEDYVFCNDRQKRSLVAQVRIGILPLRIETGRFSNIALNERHCYMCPGNDVEDEIHFICKCPLYEDLRDNLFHSALQKSPIFMTMNDTQKLVYLFRNVGRELTKFVFHAWHRRKNTLYPQG